MSTPNKTVLQKDLQLLGTRISKFLNENYRKDKHNIVLSTNNYVSVFSLCSGIDTVIDNYHYHFISINADTDTLNETILFNQYSGINFFTHKENGELDRYDRVCIVPKLQMQKVYKDIMQAVIPLFEKFCDSQDIPLHIRLQKTTGGEITALQYKNREYMADDGERTKSYNFWNLYEHK